MKTLVDFSATVGKTVHAVSHTAWPRGIVVSFTNDTFTVIAAEINDYEDYAELREGTAADFEVLNGNRDELVRLGVVTAQEWDRMKDAREQSRRAAEEAQDRRILARLQAKYQ
jgi:hypothetical protein